MIRLCVLVLAFVIGFAHDTHALDGRLQAKVDEIRSYCGSRVISAVRHTYVNGTHHISCHASGEAVDMSNNPHCIYAHLLDWQGGYSTDYARMGHVHISICAREMRLHFVHGGGHVHANSGRRHHVRSAYRPHRLHHAQKYEKQRNKGIGWFDLTQ